MVKKIKKILIANRGEIALRVISTAQEMGIKTVAIYTEDEKNALHVLKADESVSLGEGTIQETYLNKAKIIAAIKEKKADAVHPGYGFLSENAEFCELVEKEGVTFIGPNPYHMNLMGDKMASKKKVMEIGAPTIPGYHGEMQDISTLEKQAEVIGVPLLIKASAGGGGKGMRVVWHLEDFPSELESAKREAMSAFGKDEVLLEKYITKPRHIEVQVMSDTHGNHLHFLERECSIQRRHQKIIEETPSVALSDELRKSICESATKISKAINYRGAGTVEFILDEDGKYYFLEMNTRLQVEHPISEMITGVDLVRLQIQVAQNEELNISQEDIKGRGHAIECRIYAEDPKNNFFPTVGTLRKIGRHNSPGVRLDTGVRNGDKVTVNYDPMLAKLIVHAETRELAIKKSIRAIASHPFLGLVTNREYLIKILRSAPFKNGETETNFVEVNKELLEKEHDPSLKYAAAALFTAISNNQKTAATGPTHEGLSSELQGFRN